jgi:hypothetical protein
MPQRITIASHQFGLHYRDGDFVTLLRPGRHWICGEALHQKEGPSWHQT